MIVLFKGASTTNFSSDLIEAHRDPKVVKTLTETLMDELRHEVAELRSIIMALHTFYLAVVFMMTASV